jgi:ppGpp synthetase/RelA/SpoT-type nucleotidyltranferase
VPLPFPKNQVRKLGQRLRAQDLPSDDDLAMLEELLAAYDEALNVVVSAIRDSLAIAPSQRLKNTGTIIEKLRRSSATHLANIQDLAGARIVLDGGHPADQDRLVSDLAGLFEHHGWDHHVIDRRLTPMQGYRAVHIVGRVDELPVEVQIRTAWQHQWAESFEKIADRLGRSIRYSSEVDVEDVLASLRVPATVPDEIRAVTSAFTKAIVESALTYSSVIAEAEAALIDDIEAEQVEAIATRCIADMRHMVELLDAFATGPAIDAFRQERGL